MKFNPLQCTGLFLYLLKIYFQGWKKEVSGMKCNVLLSELYNIGNHDDIAIFILMHILQVSFLLFIIKKNS